MNKIKFSHRYSKLILSGYKGYVCKAMLLQVLKIKLENLSRHFLAYDTDGVYPLPKKGDYLMLIFQKGDNDIFTTLRRSTPSKSEYYTSKVGEFFQIIIEELK